jgi:hypothetical protein
MSLEMSILLNTPFHFKQFSTKLKITFLLSHEKLLMKYLIFPNPSSKIHKPYPFYHSHTISNATHLRPSPPVHIKKVLQIQVIFYLIHQIYSPHLLKFLLQSLPRINNGHSSHINAIQQYQFLHLPHIYLCKLPPHLYHLLDPQPDHKTISSVLKSHLITLPMFLQSLLPTHSSKHKNIHNGGQL